MSGWSVPTHQRWLCLFYLHCTFVKLSCLLKVTLFVTIKKKQLLINYSISLHDNLQFYSTLALQGFLVFLRPVDVNAPNYLHILLVLAHTEARHHCASSENDFNKLS